MSRAEAQGFVGRDGQASPSDGDWTSAVLAAIERPGAPPVGACLDLVGALVGRRR